jgi:hypothetical protein
VIIRTARPRWAGHVTRLEENYMTHRLKYMQPKGPRKVGRPCTRWTDDLGRDARVLGISSWQATAMNYEEGKELLKEAKTLFEL